MRATPVAARALPVLFAAEDQEFMDYLASLEDPVRAAWGQLVGWVRLRHAQAGSRIFSEAASGTGPLHVQRAPARSNAWGVGSETATQVHEAIPLAAGPDEEQGIAELTSSAATASVDSDSTSTSSSDSDSDDVCGAKDNKPTDPLDSISWVLPARSPHVHIRKGDIPLHESLDLCSCRSMSRSTSPTCRTCTVSCERRRSV